MLAGKLPEFFSRTNVSKKAIGVQMFMYLTRSGLSNNSPLLQLSGQITYRPPNHGNYTITGGYSGKNPLDLCGKLI